MPFGFLNSFLHFNIEKGFRCCCNVEFSFQKFVQNNSISAKWDAQIARLGVNKEWVGWRKSELFPIDVFPILFDARGLRPDMTTFSLRLRYDVYAGTVTSQNKYINSHRKTGKT